MIAFNFENFKKKGKDAVLAAAATVAMLPAFAGQKTEAITESSGEKKIELQEIEQQKMDLMREKTTLEQAHRDSLLAWDNLARDFHDHHAKALHFLSKKDAKEFSKAVLLPDTIERKIRELAKLPEAPKDLASKPSLDYLKSYILNWNSTGSGPMVRAMETVLLENSVASTIGAHSDDIEYHKFFNTFTTQAVHQIANILEQEKKIAQLQQGIMHYDEALREYTASN